MSRAWMRQGNHSTLLLTLRTHVGDAVNQIRAVAVHVEIDPTLRFHRPAALLRFGNVRPYGVSRGRVDNVQYSVGRCNIEPLAVGT